MDPVVALLLKNGAFGIIGGIGFYLYFRERKINQEYAQTYLNHQVSDTKAKTKLTVALEDLAVTVDTIGKNAQTDIQVCQKHVNEAMNVILTYIEDEKLEKAREEGRKEVTGRFRVPTGDKDE